MNATRLLVLLVVSAWLLLGCDAAPSATPALEEETTHAQEAAPSKRKAACDCRAVEGKLRTVVDFETFTAQGTIRGDLKGTVSFTGDPSSVAPVSAETFPPLNPETLTFTGQLQIITKRGTITTRGVGVFEAGPSGIGTEFHRIVAGTGVFSAATGTLFFDVEANETGDQFTEWLRGEICTPCEGEDEDSDED